MPLERELATYRKNLESFLSENQGKHVIIRGDEVLGFMDTYEDALKFGYDQCGVDNPFLVKVVSSEESVMFFTRDLVTN